mmetsp:Transcript_16382/g.40382  ORF Transcript_16382/g.40382 Transcript_16382/m.40382 type:complete len:83 (-) Transcript_16382:175-423(-)
MWARNGGARVCVQRVRGDGGSQQRRKKPHIHRICVLARQKCAREVQREATFLREPRVDAVHAAVSSCVQTQPPPPPAAVVAC